MSKKRDFDAFEGYVVAFGCMFLYWLLFKFLDSIMPHDGWLREWIQ